MTTPPPEDPQYGQEFGAQSPYGQQPGYGQPPAYGQSAAPQQTGPGAPGELWPRFGARIIDAIIVGVVNAIIAIVLGAGAFATGSSAGYAVTFIVTVIGVVIGLGYFAVMESQQGRTVGKMAVGLKVVGPQGGNPTIEQAIKRNIFLAFSLAGIVPIIGSLVGGLAGLVSAILIAVAINNDPATRRGWHDKFADCRVVKA
ncbi:RDD family protein [Nocardioides acrostichi]|uniref:RDD family protein n=1 Tax=Nocardioides acrostichi TaxID=2784339 RepID=A0A930V0M0_9ACTN|nr:RDD family protein [Nocardioides acrostichi]MBF4162490.1 RDD family protein [Nocardioides acrostichi]